jgi:hypothetical protein
LNLKNQLFVSLINISFITLTLDDLTNIYSKALLIQESPLAASTAATALSDEPPTAAPLAANSSPPQLQLLNDADKPLKGVSLTAATALREDPPPAAQLATNSSPPQLQLLHDVDTPLQSVISSRATAVRDGSPLQASGRAAAVVGVHSPPDATPPPGKKIIQYLLLLIFMIFQIHVFLINRNILLRTWIYPWKWSSRQPAQLLYRVSFFNLHFQLSNIK